MLCVQKITLLCPHLMKKDLLLHAVKTSVLSQHVNMRKQTLGYYCIHLTLLNMVTKSWLRCSRHRCCTVQWDQGRNSLDSIWDRTELTLPTCAEHVPVPGPSAIKVTAGIPLHQWVWPNPCFHKQRQEDCMGIMGNPRRSYTSTTCSKFSSKPESGGRCNDTNRMLYRANVWQGKRVFNCWCVRKDFFARKGRSLESIQPTSASLNQHVKQRSAY